mmetsp:Transcript_39931/g.114087  ORF Transcript_39931/g.114087 Transcript_39931/m.114087 type:complete len:255 (-) Transcript_39931:298-1062(-)
MARGPRAALSTSSARASAEQPVPWAAAPRTRQGSWSGARLTRSVRSTSRSTSPPPSSRGRGRARARSLTARSSAPCSSSNPSRRSARGSAASSATTAGRVARTTSCSPTIPAATASGSRARPAWRSASGHVSARPRGCRTSSPTSAPRTRDAASPMQHTSASASRLGSRSIRATTGSSESPAWTCQLGQCWTTRKLQRTRRYAPIHTLPRSRTSTGDSRRSGCPHAILALRRHRREQHPTWVSTPKAFFARSAG